MISNHFFQRFYTRHVSNYFHNVWKLFHVVLLQLLFSKYMESLYILCIFLNNLLIALKKLSFDEYFNIIGHISLGPNLDNSSFIFSTLINLPINSYSQKNPLQSPFWKKNLQLVSYALYLKDFSLWSWLCDWRFLRMLNLWAC